MYEVVLLNELNHLWCSERVIQLLDEARTTDAKSVAKEWGYELEADPLSD